MKRSLRNKVINNKYYKPIYGVFSIDRWEVKMQSLHWVTAVGWGDYMEVEFTSSMLIVLKKTIDLTRGLTILIHWVHGYYKHFYGVINLISIICFMEPVITKTSFVPRCGRKEIEPS